LPRFKKGEHWVTGKACDLCSEGILVIETKKPRLGVVLSKWKLVGWRIALTAVFFFLKETIRFLD
jgi:hypothetical protein